MYLQDINSNAFVSPWHDLELAPSTLQENHVTGVIEITRGQLNKMEISLEDEHNPLMQDTNTNKETGKKQLRDYKLDTIFNYGFIP